MAKLINPIYDGGGGGRTPLNHRFSPLEGDHA